MHASVCSTPQLQSSVYLSNKRNASKLITHGIGNALDLRLNYSNLGPHIKQNEKSSKSDLLNDLLNKTDESTLDHDPYSAKSCMYECRMDAVVAMCSCIMPHYMIK